MKLSRTLITAALFACLPGLTAEAEKIDRKALIARNSPVVTSLDTLASLNVGNGKFSYTVDATGMQTFPEMYSKGVPLGTQSSFGWHSFPNTGDYKPQEALRDYDFGRGRLEPYSVQFKEDGRQKDAANYFRVNPHRLHLGALGFADMKPEQITDINQRLDIWTGVITSQYKVNGKPVKVETVCDPQLDLTAVSISDPARHAVTLRLPYPTGGHCDDACNWNADEKHSTEFVTSEPGLAVVRHTLDSTVYYITLCWDSKSVAEKNGANSVVICPDRADWTLTAHFTPELPTEANPTFAAAKAASEKYWDKFWSEGGVVDFSDCTDPRAPELERRIVLSQYLLATQCAGPTPPQETGLTYNSWFGKFHLEMIWWHQAQFPLYGHEELLGRTLPWYFDALPMAREIAERQGFDGVRWMKMTDPSASEAPSGVGSFLIWQQPHLIYLAELMYRAGTNNRKVLDKYAPLVELTAEFMASFADYDAENDRYILKGIIPAQETLRAAETVNPPFELSYWHYGLSTAQLWRERQGLPRNPKWDEIIAKLSPLTAKDGLYLAAETAPETYTDIRFTSDHPAVLACYGILPDTPLFDANILDNTFDWIYDNWNWDETWGWDYPTAAMSATRFGQPKKAVDILMVDKRTNTYLANGHNYQDKRLRCYLPGNGGLLTAIACMTAGWDGCGIENPGFPKDGTWNVRWEGIKPLP